ncbi:hypothetical protein [Xenorhabdus sp. SGI240]|uniref:hypothetical protein n=1 Tax=Xenorhabdus sp. SGI240 TaxID=3158262 RepID=UPI0032B76E4E
MMNRITLTGKQILAVCKFAGIPHGEITNEELEQEFTIGDNLAIQVDGGIYIEQLGIYCTDYPEDGAMSLENNDA